MNSILIAPNSFKECISSVEVSRLIKNDILSYLPSNYPIDIQLYPLTDGGDGFLETCKYHYNLTEVSFLVASLFGDSKIEVPVGIDIKSKTCYVESADVVGVKLLKENERDPYSFTTYGIGELFEKLNDYNKKNNHLFNTVVLGIGGTSTNDFGIGVCKYFDIKTLINLNNVNVIPFDYKRIEKIEWTKPDLSYKIKVVADVNNSLLGKEGATYCFGLQKGIKEQDLQHFEDGFINILNLLNVSETTWQKLSGAGGGLAAGLQLFFSAEIVESKDFILEQLKIKDKNPDYIITGEGSYDFQSKLGKGAFVVVDYFKEKSTRAIFVISGKKNELKNVKKIEYFCLEDYFSNISQSIKNIDKGISIICKFIVEKILKEHNGK